LKIVNSQSNKFSIRNFGEIGGTELNIKRISFPTQLEEIDDINNNNIDVIIQLDDGFTYTMVVVTPQNLEHLMDKKGQTFLEAGPPMIIVKDITYESIYAAVESFCEGNAYWLKEYYLSGNFQIDLLNNMLDDMYNK